MSATKRRTAVCVGYGDGAGRLHACGSPSLPVERTGRCIRCERLQRGTQLAHVDPFVSVNDMALPGEGVYREMVATALRPVEPAVAAPEPPKPGLFALFDTPLPTAQREPEAMPWHARWPHCLLCGGTTTLHGGRGLCNTCSVRSNKWHRLGRGLAVVWLPFAGNDAGRYDQARAKRWITARDLAEAWRYLERRAAAGGIPSGGKAVIRAASKAGELPETVIRRAA